MELAVVVAVVRVLRELLESSVDLFVYNLVDRFPFSSICLVIMGEALVLLFISVNWLCVVFSESKESAEIGEEVLVQKVMEDP